MTNTERSRRYYFTGPEKEFPTQNAAQRHAEWVEKQKKDYWGDKYISSKILYGNGYYQVEVTFRAK